MVSPFVQLSSPLTVGRLTLKHRMIMGPMSECLAVDGLPGPAMLDYYLARVRGGAALITIGATEVHAGYDCARRPALAGDDAIPAFKAFTAAIHAAGAPILIQLHHGGASANPAVSPSAVPSLSTLKSGFMPSRALTLDEIEDMREHFVAAAVRAQRAGFDGIQLAGQANYLLGQFFSPRMNLRTDRYGGSSENRGRFATDIVAGIRAGCGPDFVIGYAITADELKPGGVSPEVCLPFVLAMEKAGLDLLDVRVGTHESFATSAQATAHSRFQARDGIWNYAAVFKRALSIPVFCSTQGCYDPVIWEQALAQGKTDIIQIGKPLLADAGLPDKILADRLADVRPCTYCMQCLEIFKSPSGTAPKLCAVNTQAGAEWRVEPAQASAARNVLVVGGGPAGMEAARVAAERGHRVTLLEQANVLGGDLRNIGLCDGGDVYVRLSDWMIRACARAGVTIKLGTTATPESVASHDPDVVILAHGATPAAMPQIKGIARQHVLTVAEVLGDKRSLSGNVVVIGGGQQGVQAAITIAKQTAVKSVTIIERERVAQLGQGLSHMEQAYVAMTQLPKLSIGACVGMRVEEIRAREVLLIDDQDGTRQKVKADAVVVAQGKNPSPELQTRLRGSGFRTYAIGDASTVAGVAEAIRDAASVARQI